MESVLTKKLSGKKVLSRLYIRMKHIMKEVEVLDNIEEEPLDNTEEVKLDNTEKEVLDNIEEESLEKMSSPSVTGCHKELADGAQPPSQQKEQGQVGKAIEFQISYYGSTKAAADEELQSNLGPSCSKTKSLGKVALAVAAIETSQRFIPYTLTEDFEEEAIDAKKRCLRPESSEVQYYGRVAEVVSAIEALQRHTSSKCTESLSKSKSERIQGSTSDDQNSDQAIRNNFETYYSAEVEEEEEVAECVEKSEDEKKLKENEEEEEEDPFKILKKQLIAELKLKLIELNIFVE